MTCSALIPIVFSVAASYGVEPDVAVQVMFAESSCKVEARSGAGDLGLFQVRRGITTRGYDSLTDAQLMRPRLNIKLGVRRLARAKRICGGDPERWLSNYAGLRCGSSKYSRNVLYGRGVRAANYGNSYGVTSTSSERSGYVYVDTVNVSSERRRQ